MFLLLTVLYAIAVQPVTYNATFTWYGLHDERNSSNCAAQVGACDFYLDVRLVVTVNPSWYALQ